MRRAAVVLLSCAIVVGSSLVAGCQARDQTPRGRGARTFQRTCSGCHGVDGRGGYRPGLTRPPRDLTRAEFHAQVTDEQLRQVIRLGKNQMPAFGGLMSDADITEVITFIRSLPPQSAPAAIGVGGASTVSVPNPTASAPAGQAGAAQ
jgi:mono/diheme cytochrome c family protein